MRKNIILGAVAALVTGPTAALAADLPVKAPPPVVIYDWTGFYIGASGGGSLGGSNHVDPTGQNLTQEGFRVQGGLIGGTLGYNWQVASFVFGFEGDASWVGEYGSHQDNGPSAAAAAAVDPVTGAPLFRSFTQENWLATVRGRAGYAVDNLLFYVTGGYAAAGVEAGIKDAVTSAVIASATSTRSGWTGGGGIEWGFAPNWSIKWEWLFVKFQDKGFVTHLGDGSRSAVTLDDNVVRAGINYRFGGPVVARY